MASPLLVRPSALLAKIETTKGTPATVTTSDGVFNVMDPVLNETTEFIARPQQGGFGKLRGLPGAMIGTATFRVHLEPGVGGAVPAWASTFLPACGYVESGGIFTRTGDTSLQKTITIVHYKGAGASSIKQTLAGAVGTFSITFRNGRPADVNFDFLGKYYAEATETQLDPTEPTTLPPRGYTAYTLGGASVYAPEATYAAGCERLLIEGPNDASATGYTHGIITDFNPTLTTEPYQEALSVKDWRADFVAATENALSIVVGVANPITLASARMQLAASPGFGNRVQAYTRSLTLNDNAGATIQFEAA